MQIQLPISPSHSILTPGQPVPALTPGAWQGSHWSANFKVTGMTRPRKIPGASGIRTRDLPLSRRTPELLGQRGGHNTWTQKSRPFFFFFFFFSRRKQVSTCALCLVCRPPLAALTCGSLCLIDGEMFVWDRGHLQRISAPGLVFM